METVLHHIIRSIKVQLHTNNQHMEFIGGRDPKPTYMFQSSLLGFLDDIGKKENNEESDHFIAGARRIWSPSQASTQFKRISSS